MVLVILAILAAILVPALLGWIDKAKEKQFVLEARSVYMAAQGIADEKYAASTSDTDSLKEFDTTDIANIEKMSDVASLSIPEWVLATPDATNGLTQKHANFTIEGIRIEFNSPSKGTKVGATMENGTWTVSDTGNAPAFGTEKTIIKNGALGG